MPHVNPAPSAPAARAGADRAGRRRPLEQHDTEQAPTQGGGPTRHRDDAPGRRAAADHGAGSARSRRAAQAVVRRDRKLRRVVTRLESCLPQLPNAERRVAALRAGLGEKSTRTRARVAQLLNVTRLRVARGNVARSASCARCGAMPAPGEPLPPIRTVPVDKTLAAVSLAAGFLSGGSAGTQAPRSARDVRSPGRAGKDRNAVKGVRADSPPPLAQLIPTSPEGIGLTLPLLLALAGGGWLLARRRVRRRLTA